MVAKAAPIPSRITPYGIKYGSGACGRVRPKLPTTNTAAQAKPARTTEARIQIGQDVHRTANSPASPREIISTRPNTFHGSYAWFKFFNALGPSNKMPGATVRPRPISIAATPRMPRIVAARWRSSPGMLADFSESDSTSNHGKRRWRGVPTSSGSVKYAP